MLKRHLGAVLIALFSFLAQSSAILHAQLPPPQEQPSVLAEIRTTIIRTIGAQPETVEIAVTENNLTVLRINSNMNKSTHGGRDNEANAIAPIVSKAISGRVEFKNLSTIECNMSSALRPAPPAKSSTPSIFEKLQAGYSNSTRHRPSVKQLSRGNSRRGNNRCSICLTMPQPARPQAVVFRARNLSKVYMMGEVAVHALRDIDLDIYEREFVVLLGPSGSGKSTLLNILGGLDAPTSGEAMWREHDLVNADDVELTRYRREHVGFVFQFYNLIPSLTVLENVALVNEIADRPLDPREALALVGLTERLDHFPSQLSGGEQQRVAVARAIVKSPDVLLCDEPTGALDYETGIFVLAAIARVNEQLGTTTVIITHNAAIADMADRVLRLGGGRIVGEERNSRRLSPEEVRW